MNDYVRLRNLRRLSIALFILFGILTWGIISTGLFHTLVTSLDSNFRALIVSHTALQAEPYYLAITHLADPDIVITIQIVTLLIFLFVHQEFVGILFTGSLIIGELLSIFVKNVTERARPDILFPDASRLGYSFPSSHALLAMLLYGFLAYLISTRVRKQWQKQLIYLSTGIIIFAVGYSRIALSVHWVSDVIGGWLLGGAILATMIFIYKLSRTMHAKKHQSVRIVFLGITTIVIALIGLLTMSYVLAV